MTKNEIIEKWFREGVVQNIVEKYRTSNKHYDGQKWDDLIQIVYMDLLNKDEDLIVHLNESGEYKYFIARTVQLEVASTLSRWYFIIRKYDEHFTPFSTVVENTTFEEDNDLKRHLREVYDRLNAEEKIMCDIIMNCYGKTNHGKYKFIKEALNCDISVAKKKYDKLIKKLREEFDLNNNVW